MEENLNGTPIVHEYDEHGRRIGSSGSKTARQYQWAKHQLQQLSVGEHTPLQFAYHPSGHEQTRTTEQGFSLHHQWSETGLLLEQQLGRNGDSLRQYQYDALDRLVGINDAKRGQSRFSLNANGQVQAVRQQKTWESQQRFVHLFGYDSELNLNQQGFATEYGDSDSNVVSLDEARVKRQSRKYDKAGRVLDTGRFRYHYDRCGRVVEKTEYKDGFRPKTTRFVWNGDDRLTHIELPDGGRYRYRYDPLGRRVAKECLSTQRITEYLWDGANIVQHSQKTADGSVIQEIEYLYEPESFRPLAQVTHKADQASQLHYIVTDHAGTPQELCSENGDVVWQGEQALWGHYQQRNALPNHGFRENAHNDELYCDLRYQGQIEDRESGLYYNVNRYYDADSGQYLSPDPIGFAGGLRPQAYVHNPYDFVDPLGLNSGKLNRKMGGPTGDRLSAHHVIPVDVWNKNSSFLDAIGIGGRRDSVENGIFIPGSESAFKDGVLKDMPVYHSSNHNNYSALVAQDISDISNEHAAGNMTDRQARDAVRKVQMDYKNRIWSGDVPKDCKGRLN
ncbi:RHS repeat-associated core domain-containing protein [Vibrio vulnificus]|uniref:RHS repeat domain-containing protein n=1 Tax=Vibrio vulnificus TaxID=672 RepID=UPI0040580DB9